ncbi:unnamed protein product [Lepidochelys kempii]
MLLGAQLIATDEPGRQKIGYVARSPIQNTMTSCCCRDKAELTQTVGTILLSQKKVKKGDVCSVAGWGQISIKTKTQPSPTLQEVELMITARRMYLSQPYLHYIPSRMLCVGDPQERKAPFLLRDKAELTQTVGTISLSQKKVKKGEVCSVAGWGQTSVKTNDKPSLALQEVALMVVGKKCVFLGPICTMNRPGCCAWGTPRRGSRHSWVTLGVPWAVMGRPMA